MIDIGNPSGCVTLELLITYFAHLLWFPLVAFMYKMKDIKNTILFILGV